MSDADRVSDAALVRLAPRAVLEAGGEAWAFLSESIARLMDELATGAVLEIVALEPGIQADLLAWCRSAGHETLRSWTDGDATRCWIRKGPGVRSGFD